MTKKEHGIRITLSIRDHWLYQNPNHFTWYTMMLLLAKHDVTKITLSKLELNLKAGQFCYTLSQLKDELNVKSSNSLRSLLKLLVDDNMISVRTIPDGASKYLLISILKWSEFQGDSCGNITLSPISHTDANISPGSSIVYNNKSNIESNNNTDYLDRLSQLDANQVKRLLRKGRSSIKARWNELFPQNSVQARAIKHNTKLNLLLSNFPLEKILEVMEDLALLPFINSDKPSAKNMNKFYFFTEYQNFEKVLNKEYADDGKYAKKQKGREEIYFNKSKTDWNQFME